MTTQQMVVLPAAQVGQEELVRTLNAAYANYFVPIHLTLRSFDDLVTRESVDLGASAVAVHSGKVIGMGLLAIRGQRGWIGGLGVLPAYRRRGVARRLMGYLIEQAVQRGLKTVQLEVIAQNTGAWLLYKSCGFEAARELLVLSFIGRGFYRPPPAVNDQQIVVASAPSADLLAHTYCLPGVRRPWQREWVVLETSLERSEALAAYHRTDGRLLGVCFSLGDTGHRSLLDFAAMNVETGKSLLAILLSRYPYANFSYLNVAEDDPLLPVLLEMGFAETLRQYEMFLPL